QRAEKLRQAAVELIRLRRYPESAALFDEAARDHANGAALRVFADRMRSARRHETAKLDLRKPADVTRAVFIEIFKAAAADKLPTQAVLAGLATPDFTEDLSAADNGLAIRRLTRAMARATEGIPIIALADMFAGPQTDLTVDGRPEVGYRVRI